MRTLATKGLLCALLLTACGDSLPTREQVVDLRLLGVRLDPPSAAPGETVKASALIVDLLDQGYSQSWYACLAPSSLESYLEKAPDRTECPVGDSPHGTLLGSGPDAEFTVPETFFDMLKASAEAEGLDVDAETLEFLAGITGWQLKVTLIIEGPNKTVHAQKRLLVHLLSGQNANPTPPTIVLEEVQDVDERGELTEAFTPASLIREAEASTDGACLSPGSPVASLREGVFRVTPVNLPEEPETYDAIGFKGVEEREEAYFYSWFSTFPGLSSPVSQSPDEHPISMSVGTIPPELLIDGQLPIWLIVRDGRGGTSWCQDMIPYTAPSP